MSSAEWAGEIHVTQGRVRTRWNPEALAGAHEDELKPVSVLAAFDLDGVDVPLKKLVPFITEVNTRVVRTRRS